MIKGYVLVTGANGFIASRLIPRLLANGYPVRAMARNPGSLAGRVWLPAVEVRAANTSDPESLAAAMQGVHTAFYLIHSMSTGRGYTEVERRSARQFAAAAEAAQVKHIIYVGGLADPNDPHLAPHMRSRIETGEILRQGRVPVTEFRAGVIAGAGSISFEMVRFLAEFFPVLPGPRWLRNQAQPIASENVIDYLMAGLARPETRGGIFEMGGPEQMQFGEVMLRYARHRGLKRLLFTLPGIPIWFMAWVVDRLTPVPRPIAAALIGGLQSDSRVVDTASRLAFPEVQLIPYEAAVQQALGELAPERLERVWEGMERDLISFRHEGFIIDYRTRQVSAPAGTLFQQLSQMGGRNRWPYADWLWRLRGWLDGLFARRVPPEAIQMTAGKRGDQDSGLRVGQGLDYYRVAALEPGQLLRLQSTLCAPGEGWLEWRVEALSDTTSRLTQTAFFAPRGFPGLLYWLATEPLHRIVLGGLVDALKRRSESR
ncbi:MAG TPA: DUF2867 domain-containing protein [Anaerolineales bacterium]|nr:DUF2867 domain-containing protein [Anaerolineales bacterium]